MTRKALQSVDLEVDAEGRATFDKALDTINPSDCSTFSETPSANAWTEIAEFPANTRVVHIAVRAASVYLMVSDASPSSGDGLVCLVNSERRLATAGKAKLWAKSLATDAHGQVSGIAYQSA